MNCWYYCYGCNHNTSTREVQGIGNLRYHNEMMDSFTLSHEAVTNLNTDSNAQREQSSGSPHVIRGENKEEQPRQNCGTTGQKDVVLVRVIFEHLSSTPADSAAGDRERKTHTTP